MTNEPQGKNTKDKKMIIHLFQMLPNLKIIPRKEVFDAYKYIFVEDLYWKDQENIFFTMAMSEKSFKNKTLGQKQGIIIIDLDRVEEEDVQFHYKLVQEAFKEINVDEEKLGLVRSGNGIHVVMLLQREFDVSPGFFKMHRPGFKHFCKRIQEKCKKDVLVDTSSFGTNQIMRLPGTLNCKLNVKKECRTLVRPQKVDLICPFGPKEVAPSLDN